MKVTQCHYSYLLNLIHIHLRLSRDTVTDVCHKVSVTVTAIDFFWTNAFSSFHSNLKHFPIKYLFLYADFCEKLRGMWISKVKHKWNVPLQKFQTRYYNDVATAGIQPYCCDANQKFKRTCSRLNQKDDYTNKQLLTNVKSMYT